MTVLQAIDKLKKGRKVKREPWRNTYLVLDNDELYIVCNGFIYKYSVFTFEEVLANDWVVVDE